MSAARLRASVEHGDRDSSELGSRHVSCSSSLIAGRIVARASNLMTGQTSVMQIDGSAGFVHPSLHDDDLGRADLRTGGSSRHCNQTLVQIC